jgi:hypothetical protein
MGLRDFLEYAEKGYKVSENSFILAVQGDGLNYVKAKTARHRDKLRELVLRQLD